MTTTTTKRHLPGYINPHTWFEADGPYPANGFPLAQKLVDKATKYGGKFEVRVSKYDISISHSAGGYELFSARNFKRWFDAGVFIPGMIRITKDMIRKHEFTCLTKALYDKVMGTK